MGFQFTRKSGAYWTSYVRNERPNRNKHGCAIPYKYLTQFDLREEYFRRAFPRLTRRWSRMEVPRVLFADLLPVFTSQSGELMDADSGRWVLAYTEFAAKVAAFILYEVYDQFRLWALSAIMVHYIRALDLTAILGNNENANELFELLAKIEAPRFETLPEDWG